MNAMTFKNNRTKYLNKKTALFTLIAVSLAVLLPVATSFAQTVSFSPATNFAVGSRPHSVVIGDLNGDGKPDLAVANAFSHTVSILLGTGTGSFEAATDFAVGSNPYSVAIGDLNGDGKPDLATANVGSNTVSILLGTGTGSFGAATDFAVGLTPLSVAIGDLNGDGKPDLATTNVGSTNVSILLNTTQSLSGDTRAWGNNLVGQLGNGTFGISNTPTSVSNLSQVSAISGGAAHSLAVKADGSAWAWGDNDRGQLGNGTSIISNVPVAVSGLTQLSAVAAGGAHSLAVKKDGTVWAWGDNHLGQLGHGTAGGNSPLPVQVTGLSNITKIVTGLAHSLARSTDGTVHAWGANTYGQLGDGTVFTIRSTPILVQGLTGVIELGAGGIHSLALKSDGTAWAWGNNFTGQLGTGSFTSSPVPVQVNGLTGGLFIAGGGAHSLAVVTSSSP